MELASHPVRHDMLFELLRQQGASEQTCRRLDAKQQSEVEEKQAVAFLESAIQSWNMPEVAEIAEPEVYVSAPEPGGYHEFFRAVRP